MASRPKVMNVSFALGQSYAGSVVLLDVRVDAIEGLLRSTEAAAGGIVDSGTKTYAKRIHGRVRARRRMGRRLLSGNSGRQRPGPDQGPSPAKPGAGDRLDPRRPPRGRAARHAAGGGARDRRSRMKRSSLLQHLRRHGCILKRE